MISKRFEFPGPWAAHEFFKLESLVLIGPPKAAPILFLLSPEVSGTSVTMSIYIYIYIYIYVNNMAVF